MIELRCANKLHAKMGSGLIEVRCKSAYCGAQSGVVVIHKFNSAGTLVDTKKFKNSRKVVQ